MSLGHAPETSSVSAPSSAQVAADSHLPMPANWRTCSRKSPDAAQGRPCCLSGRSVMTDPRAGQRVCSCQYNSALLSPYTRLPLSSNIFAPAGSYSSRPQLTPTTLSGEGSAFDTPLGANGSNIRDHVDAWRPMTQPSLSDASSMAFYPCRSSYGGLDLNPRRKNATRESTNTLKAWLQEHIKNPYPTKGEKIMLAIITKMTLTQVSTWFANARRRLKKDDKLAWSPKHTSDDGVDDEDCENTTSGDEGQCCSGHGRERDENLDVETHSSDVTMTAEFSKVTAIRNNENESSTCRLSPDLNPDPPPTVGYHAHADADSHKQKIWSVTDFLGSASDDRYKSRLASPHVFGQNSNFGPHPPDKLRDPSSVAFFGCSMAVSDGTSPIGVPSQSAAGLHAALACDARHFPYTIPSFDGLMGRPPLTATLCRIGPFPTARSLRVDSTCDPRRDIPFSVKGL